MSTYLSFTEFIALLRAYVAELEKKEKEAKAKPPPEPKPAPPPAPKVEEVKKEPAPPVQHGFGFANRAL